jgi:glycosyltransferase involved in cell wall biosynthesis
MDMKISVAIPTCNRADILRKTLKGYSAQAGDHQMLEVLVVDDGSRDHTAATVEECSRASLVPVRYLYQENRGLAAARNHGLREAKGELILFGDDDIIPGSEMVAQHMAWHRRYPQPEVGVLGHVAWAPELRPSGFMKWETLYGPQFRFGYMEPGQEVGFGEAYFCNTSVKSCFLRQYGNFNEAFRQYGWEDLELGYRLMQKGWRMLYNPDAVGYHYKHERLDDVLRRIERGYQTWPLYLQTEAGAHHAALDQRRAPGAAMQKKPLAKRLLRPLKGPAMALLRPLVDTRIPLPRWVYESVWYHYATPLFDPKFWNDPQIES